MGSATVAKYDMKPETEKTDILSAEAWKNRLDLRRSHGVEPWSEAELDELCAFNEEACGDGKLPEALGDNTDALGNTETLVVITGQQAGLFLSPLYTLYKAVAAIKWAEHLGTTLGRRVIPAFWIASEDHDFEEIQSACYLTRKGDVADWQYDYDHPAGQSVFDIPADDEKLAEYLDLLDERTHPSEFKEVLLGEWREMIAASENLENFFARGMMRLLGEYGLVLVSSRLEALRRRGAGILRREIEKAGAATQALIATAEKRKAEGRPTPIHRNADDVNFFVYRNGRRCKVVRQDDAFAILNPESNEPIETMSANALLRELDESPAHFSPNVATRPLIQDAALPVIAMVGGPGEQAYVDMLIEAGLPELYETCPNHVLHRPRALLVEPRVERQLEKYDISESILEQEDWDGLEENFERHGDYGEALEAMDSLKESQKQAFDRFAQKIGSLAETPEIKSAIKKTFGSEQKSLGKLEGRLRQVIKREQDNAGLHRDRIMQSLRPKGHPQERTLGPLSPFLLNYGNAFVDFVVEELEIEPRHVQILMLSQIGEKA